MMNFHAPERAAVRLERCGGRWLVRQENLLWIS
jgi:hypothetical protein